MFPVERLQHHSERVLQATLYAPLLCSHIPNGCFRHALLAGEQLCIMLHIMRVGQGWWGRQQHVARGQRRQARPLQRAGQQPGERSSGRQVRAYGR